MNVTGRILIAALIAALTLTVFAPAAAPAAPLADDGNAEWQVEQPPPPAPGEPGVEASSTPVSMGHIGDIEFWAPNRGALITAGNGGSVEPGVWFYDGAQWRELSNVCGATDGRIVWAGPEEFWTVSDGRAGQAAAAGGQIPPLADNTLCHFAPGPGGNLEIVASYASVPFLGSSYQAMHAAGCLTSSDCWFGGEPLPPPQVGAFMLHWNGVTLEPQPYLPEGHPIWDMKPFEGRLYESMLLRESDKVQGEGVARPAPLRRIKHAEAPEESPFASVGLPLLYSTQEHSYALDYLHLSTASEALWAGAGPQLENPGGGRPAGVTIARKTAEGGWHRVIGPREEETALQEEEEPPGAKLFPERVLSALSAEPGTDSAWIGLESLGDAKAEAAHVFNRLARAQLARVDSEGTVSDRLEMPIPGDPHGPLGNTQRIVCPRVHDCWATTAGGWLLHLASAEERGQPEAGDAEHPSPVTDPVFAAIEEGRPITTRPHDQGVPQEPLDELPENNSGEGSFTRVEEVIKAPPPEPAKTTLPLLTHLRTKVIHGTTLVLSFHLAVKAKLRLLALRRKKVIGQTAMKTFRAGNGSLQLKLDPKRWPEHLKLQTHALAPLPTVTTANPNVSAVSTSVVTPARLIVRELGF